MITCSKCGGQNPDNALFCRHCGNKLANTHIVASKKDNSAIGWILVCVGIAILVAFICKCFFYSYANDNNVSTAIPKPFHYENLITDDFVFVYPSFMTHSKSISGDHLLAINSSNQITIKSWRYNGEDITTLFNNDKNSSYQPTYTRNNRQNKWYVISGYYSDGSAYYKKVALYNGNWVKAEFHFEKEYKPAFESIILEHCFRRFPSKKEGEY